VPAFNIGQDKRLIVAAAMFRFKACSLADISLLVPHKYSVKCVNTRPRMGRCVDQFCKEPRPKLTKIESALSGLKAKIDGTVQNAEQEVRSR
jgi:hypothetical protein